MHGLHPAGQNDSAGQERPYEEKGAAEDRLAGASGCYQTPADGFRREANGVGRRDPPEEGPERQRDQPALAYAKLALVSIA